MLTVSRVVADVLVSRLWTLETRTGGRVVRGGVIELEVVEGHAGLGSHQAEPVTRATGGSVVDHLIGLPHHPGGDVPLSNEPAQLIGA